MTIIIKCPVIVMHALSLFPRATSAQPPTRDTGPFFTHKCPQKSAAYTHHLLANPIKEARGFRGIFSLQSSGPSCSALETSSDNLQLRCLFTGQVNVRMTKMTLHFFYSVIFNIFIVFPLKLKSNLEEKDIMN